MTSACKRCGGAKPLGKGRKLCSACPPLTRSEKRVRYRDKRRKHVKGTCVRCGGPKPLGTGRKLCDACPPFARVEISARYRDRNPYRWMLNTTRVRAEKKGLPFDLTDEDVVVPAACPVLGIPIQRAEGCTADYSPSIDRVDNTKGYVKGNVIVVSWRANRLKNDATIEELRAIADFYEMYTITQ